MLAALRLILLAAALALASPATAAKRAALVFAAEKYAALRPLANPGNDADAVAATLEKLGFAVTQESDRDLRRMRRALDDFREDAAGAETVLVYFAGHGVEISGENRLLPVDADASSLEALKRTSLPLEDIRAAAAAIAPSALILVDACRDDPFGTSSGGGRSAKPLGADVKVAARPGFGRVGAAEGALFAFAAAPGETASDGDDGHSPFAAALARLLATDGLEIRSVLTLVQQEVYETTGGRQLPYIESGLPRLFFAAETGDLPERERLLLAMADVTPDMRADVESVAQDAEMPLGPLYGALISADLKSATADDRRKRLEEAAAAFVKTRDDLRRLSGGDPRVDALRAEAGKALALGAFDTARTKLADAIAIDEASRTALKANFVERTASAAETRSVAANAALATLDRKAAIAEFEAAAALYREIENDPLPAATRSRSIWLLADLGDLHDVVGNTAAAKRAYDAMRAAAERHLAAEPASAEAQRNLAAAMIRQANGLADSGATAAALAAYREGLALAEQLHRARPDNPDLARDLAIAWEKTGDVAFVLGDLKLAAQAFAADVDLARQLADAKPGDAEARRDLALALERLAGVRRALGDSVAALELLDAAIAQKRALVADFPDVPRHRHDLGIGLSVAADLRMAMNDMDGALPELEEASALFAALTAEDPANVFFSRSLAQALSQEALLWRSVGETARSIDGFSDAIERFRALAAADPANGRTGRDLSGALANLASAFRQDGRLKDAEAAIAEALDLNGALLKADPGNADLERDRLLALERQGDIAYSAKDGAAALESYQAARELADDLVTRTGGASARRDLSAMAMKQGDALRALGRKKQAIAAYREALDVRRELAEAEPGNPARQRDLILAHSRMAEMGVERRANLKAALAIAERLEASGRLAASDANIPGRLRQALAETP